MARTKNTSREKTARGSTLDKRRPEDQLALKDRVLAEAAEGITIADATLTDHPLVYVNKGFEQLTGYSAESVQGRNCRFLQGPDTDPEAADEIRRAVREGRPCVVEILNYRKNGTPFWNRLSITPVRDDTGALTHFIGIQSDVTARRNAEDALRQAKAELEEANRLIKRDLETASAVQRSYLPSRAPAVEGTQVAWELLPCDELAGDTLNVVSLDDRYVVLYVIDVSGHGVQAALLSSALTHWLSLSAGGRAAGAGSAPRDRDGPAGAPRVERSGASLSPARVAEHLNERFPQDPDTGQYFTMIYGVLDVRSREFRYVTAGHPAPVRVSRDGRPHLQSSRGFPVGIVPEPRFEEKVLRLDPGDRVYLYSDGLIDAVNERGEPFDTKRLREEIQRTRGESIEESVAAVVRRVTDWSKHTHVEDDISILAFEVE